MASDRDPGNFLEWARLAESCGFSTLALVDRIVFPNYEPIVAFAAAAAVTTKIRLTTSILIGPYRPNTALLAKQLATLDRLSAGRLTVGIGIGAREDDYTASGLEPKGRGVRLEEQILELRTIWSGEVRGCSGAVGPTPVRNQGPEILVAGHVPAALRRAGRIGDGWMMGGGQPRQFKEMVEQVDDEWTVNGRDGFPRTSALASFSLGPHAEENARDFLGKYYNFLPDAGDQALIDASGSENMAEAMFGEVALDDDRVGQLADEWSIVGCDELIFLPCNDGPDQVTLLSHALGTRLEPQK
jgi:alkanesulfonate monooxygenase SsuD/methylene tetrahydromethanopterin reductase-like flavin-dependent oxidoreductase (luciferase family)